MHWDSESEPAVLLLLGILEGRQPNRTAFAKSPVASQGERQCMLMCIGKQD